jgi:hypothetical protein
LIFSRILGQGTQIRSYFMLFQISAVFYFLFPSAGFFVFSSVNLPQPVLFAVHFQAAQRRASFYAHLLLLASARYIGRQVKIIHCQVATAAQLIIILRCGPHVESLKYMLGYPATVFSLFVFEVSNSE